MRLRRVRKAILKGVNTRSCVAESLSGCCQVVAPCFGLWWPTGSTSSPIDTDSTPLRQHPPRSSGRVSGVAVQRLSSPAIITPLRVFSVHRKASREIWPGSPMMLKYLLALVELCVFLSVHSLTSALRPVPPAGSARAAQWFSMMPDSLQVLSKCRFNRLSCYIHVLNESGTKCAHGLCPS